MADRRSHDTSTVGMVSRDEIVQTWLDGCNVHEYHGSVEQGSQTVAAPRLTARGTYRR
jgi:hypothetical protein